MAHEHPVMSVKYLRHAGLSRQGAQFFSWWTPAAHCAAATGLPGSVAVLSFHADQAGRSLCKWNMAG
jgi:hypothetical protein